MAGQALYCGFRPLPVRAARRLCGQVGLKWHDSSSWNYRDWCRSNDQLLAAGSGLLQSDLVEVRV